MYCICLKKMNKHYTSISTTDRLKTHTSFPYIFSKKEIQRHKIASIGDYTLKNYYSGLNKHLPLLSFSMSPFYFILYLLKGRYDL